MDKNIATIFCKDNIQSGSDILAKWKRSNKVYLSVKMGRGKTGSPEVRDIIIRRFLNGEKQVRIAQSLLLNKSVISRIVKKYQETGSPKKTKNTGRPRKTTRRIDKTILRIAQKNPFMTYTHKLSTKLAILAM